MLYQSKCFNLFGTLLIPVGLILIQHNESYAQPLMNSNALSELATFRESQQEQAYILGVGDQVDISVFDYAEFNGSRVILPDGSITLPLLGSVPIAGQTTDQFAQNLTVRLRTLLINPVVTVTLSSFRPVLVNVSGEIRRPGPLQLDTLEDGTPTLSAAIASAGGITQNADIRQITVQRAGSPPRVIDLWAAITSESENVDIILQGGDSIYIPKLADTTQVDRRLIARSSFSPALIQVRVIGEVNEPGEIQLTPDSSISSAIASAGGPTEDARLRSVSLIRLSSEGEFERQTFDLRDLTDNYQIQDGDVVIVPKSDSASILDAAGRLLTPLNFILNLF